MPFNPGRVMFEAAALEYPRGRELYQYFKNQPVEFSVIGSHNRVTGIPARTPQQGFMEAKRTLVFGVRRTLRFETCKPSAHYQLPLATGCPGRCQYCYLLTSMPQKPYLRAYVNVEEILDKAGEYIKQRLPEVTVFEGAATSDPVPVERYTGALGLAIEFFARQEQGRFRFVTKFTEVEPLLGLEHRRHTRIRFSLNTDSVIGRFEGGTPRLTERIATARSTAAAGYPLGFIIAPIIAYPGWEEEYTGMLEDLKASLGDAPDLTFELISHRFTTRAKNRIQELFPNSGLPLETEDREYKYGQFGYGKYLYPREERERIREILADGINRRFPLARVEYSI
ncbi:MAG: spore photoproduct lyase [Firmicutes bacterium]|nr:spore photoproduct lyase [Bacillota bacterium]